MNKGADLECIFLYKEVISFDFISSVLDVFDNFFFKPSEEQALTVFCNNHYLPDLIASKDFLKKIFFIDLINNYFTYKIIIRHEGEIFNTQVKIRSVFDLNSKSLVVSTPEGFIWNYNTELNDPKLDRINTFFNILASISDVMRPISILVSNSSMLPSELNEKIILENNFLKYSFSEKKLSDEAALDLYNWYVNKY